MAGEHKFYDWARRGNMKADDRMGWLPDKEKWLIGWGTETTQPADVYVYVNTTTGNVLAENVSASG